MFMSKRSGGEQYFVRLIDTHIYASFLIKQNIDTYLPYLIILKISQDTVQSSSPNRTGTRLLLRGYRFHQFNNSAPIRSQETPPPTLPPILPRVVSRVDCLEQNSRWR